MVNVTRDIVAKNTIMSIFAISAAFHATRASAIIADFSVPISAMDTSFSNQMKDIWYQIYHIGRIGDQSADANSADGLFTTSTDRIAVKPKFRTPVAVLNAEHATGVGFEILAVIPATFLSEKFAFSSRDKKIGQYRSADHDRKTPESRFIDGPVFRENGFAAFPARDSDFDQNGVHFVFRLGDPNKPTSSGSFSAVAIPEPMSWALMSAGFALMGGSLRRIKRASNIRSD
jgi:hypothetical protein